MNTLVFRENTLNYSYRWELKILERFLKVVVTRLNMGSRTIWSVLRFLAMIYWDFWYDVDSCLSSFGRPVGRELNSIAFHVNRFGGIFFILKHIGVFVYVIVVSFFSPRSCVTHLNTFTSKNWLFLAINQTKFQCSRGQNIFKLTFWYNNMQLNRTSRSRANFVSKWKVLTRYIRFKIVKVSVPVNFAIRFFF